MECFLNLHRIHRVKSPQRKFGQRGGAFKKKKKHSTLTNPIFYSQFSHFVTAPWQAALGRFVELNCQIQSGKNQNIFLLLRKAFGVFCSSFKCKNVIFCSIHTNLFRNSSQSIFDLFLLLLLWRLRAACSSRHLLSSWLKRKLIGCFLRLLRVELRKTDEQDFKRGISVIQPQG